MATYTLTAEPSGSSQDNDATRTISSLWAYDSTKYKTITSITRTNGVWCSCGGTSQSVTMNVYAELLINGTTYMTSPTVTCKSYGSGPSSDNYATTTFTITKTADSNALIAAWAAGTLQIKWFVSIKSYTSSGHGSPTFRDGQYNDVITLVGEDVPPTNYKPVIDTFTVDRESSTSTTVNCKIKLSMTDQTGLNDNPHLYLCYMANSDPIYNQSGATSVDLKNDISSYLSSEGTVTITGISASSDYHFGLVFTAGDETSGYMYRIAPKSSVPLHINKTNSGVGIGGYSKSETASDRRVDVHWPLYVHEPIYALGGIIGCMQCGRTDAITVNKAKYADVAVTFPTPFTEAPTVMLTLETSSVAYAMGGFLPTLLPGSITTTGFTMRLFNNTGANRTFYMNWLAYGQMQM